MQAYVGADWSAKRLVCAVAVGDGKPRRIGGAEPSLASVQELIRRVRDLEPQITEVLVVIEAGAPGWVKLLHEAVAIVHVADPKQAKRFAESLSSSGAKADGRDATTLVHMLRSPPHRPRVWEPEAELEPLRRLSAMHEQLTKQLTQTKQRLRDRLKELMPLVNAELNNLASAWVVRFLEAVPTPWHATGLDETAFTKLTKGGSVERRQRLWQALAASQAPWLTEELAEVEALHVLTLLEQLRQLTEQLGAVSDRIEKQTKAFAARPLLESVTGIGLLQMSALLAFAFGMPVTSRDHAGTQMGACPVFVGSGTRADGSPKGHARMRRSANYRARRTMYLLGFISTRHLTWAAAMYADGRRRGQSAATAYRRIARSLLRILTAMVRNQQPYDEARYVAALKAKGVAWAESL